MNRIFLFLVGIIISSSLSAQEKKIQWSELNRKGGTLLDIYPREDEGFYALRWSGGQLLGHYDVSEHHDLKQTGKGIIKKSTSAGIATFEAASAIGNKFVVFLSDKREGKNFLLMQEYDSNLTPTKEAVELASFDLLKGRSKGYFDIQISPNKEFLAVIWEIPGKKEDKDIYGFKIFDKELNAVNEGEYPLPFPGDLSVIHSHFISNKGEYFLALTEFQEAEKKMFNRTNQFKALHIYHIAQDGLLDFILDLKGKRVETMAMSTFEDDEFMITGIYGEEDQVGVAGVFYQRINLETQKVLSEGFREFTKDFITQGWTDKQKEKADRREEKGKGEPQLYNYQMRDITLLEDGSIVGTMEQYYVHVRSYMDTRSGQTSYTYYYYYNDIIIYKIGIEGQFDWIEKIRKYQVSVNDGGPLSSYESYIDNGKLCLIFNDNLRNYDADGKYMDDDKLYPANYSNKNNVVALATVDLNSGKISREHFLDSSDIGAVVVPKLFNVNYQKGEMLLYAIYGRKEKFGLLKLED